MKQVASIASARGRQQGAALIVVLMLLVIITILGIASMRGAIMQERMAANVTTRGMAFQVAEAGLRQAEIIARDADIDWATVATGCNAGRCKGVSKDWSVNDGFWNDGGTGYQTGNAVAVGNNVSISPRFVIEDFGTTSVDTGGAAEYIDMSKKNAGSGVKQSVYRITSYAATPNGAEVILQSIYRR